MAGVDDGVIYIRMGLCKSCEGKRFTPPVGSLINISSISGATILDSTVHVDIQHYYEFKRVIGQGQFGTVREAIRLGSEGHRVAIKSLRKEAVTHNLTVLRRELLIIRSLDHPNIVKYYETFEDSKYLHVVMELCEGGDLFDHVISQGGLTEEEVARIMRKLMHAVNYMHELNICHRDLKPENFLYSSASTDADIKVADFGMATGFSSTGDSLSSFVGTPYYMAPEVIRGVYGKECDIWSLGVVMFFLLSGEQPFIGNGLPQIYQKISTSSYSFSGPAWDFVSPQAKRLVRRLLVQDPQSRIRLKDALSDPWFNAISLLSPKAVSTHVLGALRRYKAPKRFQGEVIRLLVKYMSPKEIEDLKTAFLAIDREKTGFVTTKDLEIVMKRAGSSMSSEELTRLGTNCEGKIPYSEFLVAAFDRRRLLDEELMFLAFSRFDVDNDGVISRQDMETSLKNLGTELESDDLNQVLSLSEEEPCINFERFKAIVQDQDDIGYTSPVTRRERQKSVKQTFTMVANLYT